MALSLPCRPNLPPGFIPGEKADPEKGRANVFFSGFRSKANF
jgi:hypothetical protein